MMKRDPALIEVMKERNHGNPELVQAALLTLKRLISPQNGVETTPILESIKASPIFEVVEVVHGAIDETRFSTKRIFLLQCVGAGFRRPELRCQQHRKGSKPKTMYVGNHLRKVIPAREMLLISGHSLVVRMNKGGKREINFS